MKTAINISGGRAGRKDAGTYRRRADKLVITRSLSAFYKIEERERRNNMVKENGILLENEKQANKIVAHIIS